MSLALPSDADLSAELAELLSGLRIPAAVRHTRLFGTGTMAMVPADAEMSVLAMTEGYGPEVGWVHTDEALLITALDALAGPGTLIDDQPFTARRGALRSDDLMPTPDSPAAVSRERPESPDILASSAPVTVVAWTTHQRRDEIAMMGARLSMVFDSVDAGPLGIALKPANPGRVAEAMARELWRAHDGIAVWRAGDEAAAAFVQRGETAFAAWDARWIVVDPSRPGQLVGGRPLSARLRDATSRDHDPAAWIKQFRLDEGRATRLRALFRREPHREVLSELMTTLALPHDWLRLLSDAPDDTDRIEPRSERQLISSEPQRMMNDGTAEPQMPFRHRHPRRWLALALCGIIAFAAYGTTRVLSGAGTGWGLVVGSAICLILLVLDDAFARAWRGAPDESRKDPDATG
ncbi:hypothetical protein MIAR_33400 [Microbacterium arabinogalactanolyticum]|nr:hypothetical protein MIAR_33400 [Microbacterium arabinogalactanolyticum]